MNFRIAQHDDRTPPWRNFVLLVDGDPRRYQLGWNGERFARDTGLRNLCERYPALSEDVCDWLKSSTKNTEGKGRVR